MRGGLIKGPGQGVRPQDQGAAQGEAARTLPVLGRDAAHAAVLGQASLQVGQDLQPKENTPRRWAWARPSHLPPGSRFLPRAGPRTFPTHPVPLAASTQVAATCSAEGSEVKGRDDPEPPPLHQHTVVSFLQWVCLLR